MSASKIVSRKFAEDFELVANHYRLHELGEYESAKEAARNDLENAMTTFASLAEELNGLDFDARKALEIVKAARQ